MQCGDNRFEIIEKAKKHLINATNIKDSPEEMEVIDSILFRCWQMGWLAKYDLEDEIGMPLDIPLRALKEGIYSQEFGELEKYDVRGIELDGLGVISNICPYAECDFTCDYKDYKKTWWLKADKSE